MPRLHAIELVSSAKLRLLPRGRKVRQALAPLGLRIGHRRRGRQTTMHLSNFEYDDIKDVSRVLTVKVSDRCSEIRRGIDNSGTEKL